MSGSKESTVAALRRWELTSFSFDRYYFWFFNSLNSPSLSQRCVHHSMVTRFPNHWCAVSWFTTMATHCLLDCEELAGSTRMQLSLTTRTFYIWLCLNINSSIHFGISILFEFTSIISSYQEYSLNVFNQERNMYTTARSHFKVSLRRTKDVLAKSERCVLFSLVSEVINPPTLGYLHRCKIGIDSLQ